MQKKILVLVSNPEETKPLNLPRELRKLQESVQRSQKQNDFTVELRFAASQTDLRRHILDVKPQIIHFCGHGTEQGLVLEDEAGRAKVVPNEVLTNLLRAFSDRVECVVLNACNSEPLANDLVQHLNYVIGMNQEVRDDAAIAFAEGFYDALGAGEPYERAFEIGKNAVLGKAILRHATDAPGRKATVVGQDGKPVQVQNREHWIPVLKVNPNPTPIQPLSLADQPSPRKAELIDVGLYSQYQNCDRWAVIVGISRYKNDRLNLKYADRDAEELYNVLMTPNGGRFKREHICKLTNEEATTGNITWALRSFLKKPAREDLVVIYFACHGAPDFDRPSNIYLLSHDSDPDDIAGTALPMREIDLSLKENLHAEKVIVLVDACHSAAISGGIGRRAMGDSALLNCYLQQISQAKGGLALLTSAEANEVSLEDARWGGGHGVFTHYLLEGMRGAADIDQNGIITIGELFEYVRDNVKRATNYKQHPLIGSNAFDRNLPISLVSQELQTTERLIGFPEQNEIVELGIPEAQKARLHELFHAKIHSFKFKVISVNEFGQLINERHQTAECFVEDLGNGIRLELIFIPEGRFVMGASEAESKRYPEERPQHQVKVNPFLMSKYPITNAQWKAIASLQQADRKLKLRPSGKWAANQPVVKVSWLDAIEFCERLSQKTGNEYRLATEAEWEYACRAGTETPFHFGEAIISDIANCDATFPYRSAPVGIKRDGTTASGNFQVANRFGLFDMHGNVWEWCLDHWHDSYDGAPISGEAWLSENENPNHVLRGGSWRNDPIRCRSASRWYGRLDEAANNIGFRLVLSL